MNARNLENNPKPKVMRNLLGLEINLELILLITLNLATFITTILTGVLAAAAVCVLTVLVLYLRLINSEDFENVWPGILILGIELLVLLIMILSFVG